jgi:hypothetical protein
MAINRNGGIDDTRGDPDLQLEEMGAKSGRGILPL